MRHISLLSVALPPNPPDPVTPLYPPASGQQEKNTSPETTSDGKRSCLQVCLLREHGNGL